MILSPFTSHFSVHFHWKVMINGPVKLAAPPSCPPSAATSRAINSASPGKNLSILRR